MSKSNTKEALIQKKIKCIKLDNIKAIIFTNLESSNHQKRHTWTTKTIIT